MYSIGFTNCNPRKSKTHSANCHQNWYALPKFDRSFIFLSCQESMQHLDQTKHLLVAQLTRYEVYFYFTHFHCAKFSNFIILIHLINKIHQTRNSSLFLFILNVFQLRHHKIAQRTNRKLKSTILSKKKNTT